MVIKGGMKSFRPFLRKWGGSMRKSMLLARSGFRKAKGQTAALVVLLLLAAFMLNIWLMLSTDYKQNFSRCHDRLNAEHVMLLADCDEEAFQTRLTERLKEDVRTSAFGMDSVLWAYGSFEYNGGTVDVSGFFLRKDTAVSREIGKVEITEEVPGSGIYLPMLYGLGNNYKTGDRITLTLSGKTMCYTVRGFLTVLWPDPTIAASIHFC